MLSSGPQKVQEKALIFFSSSSPFLQILTTIDFFRSNSISKTAQYIFSFSFICSIDLTRRMESLIKNDDYVKEAPAYCQSSLDGLQKSYAKVV